MRGLSLILLLLFPSLLVAESSEITKEEQIQVAFAPEARSIVGFSWRDVSDIRKVTDVPSGSLELEYYPQEQHYSTERDFYAYGQIFTTSPVTLSIKLNPLTAGEGENSVSVDWYTTSIQIGSNYLSSADGAYAFYDETEGSVIPRATAQLISPVVDVEAVSKIADDTILTGSVVITLTDKGE